MKKELKDWFVPWLFTSREYNVGILDQAMANPDHARLMLNENPIGPSEKVIEAVIPAELLDEEPQGVGFGSDVVVADQEQTVVVCPSRQPSHEPATALVSPEFGLDGSGVFVALMP